MIRNTEVKVVKPTTEPESQSINHEDKNEWLQTRPGERCRIRVSAAETNGAYSVVEIVSDARDGTPMHIHQNEDEHFIILEGTARIASGDKTFDAAAGTAVTLSKCVPHAWCNLIDSPLRMVVIASPGGIEEILRLIAKRGGIDIMALSEKFGVRNIGPMLPSQLMPIVRSTEKDMKPESAYGCTR
jgi:mannose-6-phosphate isomerase-like protein (cupin superfamily)